ncbi:MAG: hypothetical protein AAF468_12515 [Pseudomonadota bacterium]
MTAFYLILRFVTFLAFYLVFAYVLGAPLHDGLALDVTRTNWADMSVWFVWFFSPLLWFGLLGVAIMGIAIAVGLAIKLWKAR